MQSILYVRLPCQKIYPGGVVMVADYVYKHNPEVKQKIIDLSLTDKNKRSDLLVDEVGSFNPDIIAFSWRDVQIFAPHEEDVSFQKAIQFYYSPSVLKRIGASFDGLKGLIKYEGVIKENLSYLNLIKEKYPQKQILLGGPAFSVFSEQLINKCPDGTIGVVGEGEDVVSRLVKGEDILKNRVVIKKGNEIIKGDEKSFLDGDKLEAIDYDYISSIFPQFSEYLSDFVGIQTKRGCVQKCIFCLYRFIEGTKVRNRSPKAIADEIEMLNKKYNVKKIWFTDAQFCSNKDSVGICEETLDEIIRRRVKIEWRGYIRIENTTPSLAKKMIDSGISTFELSLTSGSQKIIDNLELNFSLDDVLKACQIIKKAGYSSQEILVNFSLNAPGETKETLIETLKFYRKLEDIFGKGNVKPFIFFLAVQPHTKLEKLSIEKGYLSPKYNPISLNPFWIKGLIYNPPPLGKMLAEICLDVWKSQGINSAGSEILNRLEKKLM
ncbi:MAG: radical SAM protein [Actinobacteria bacterium]|nr:radical SAM protein [Actinomycetota bacterium]